METLSQNFFNLLLNHFPHTPTSLQKKLLEEFSTFVVEESNQSIFLLKGFAGTGKTTVVSTIVNQLWKINLKSLLLAPTGRAAKVLSVYSEMNAYTIHKKIYLTKRNPSGGIIFEIKKNTFSNTIFFVDESSMISDKSEDASIFKNASLLSDLIQFVYSGKNCKLVFIGDTAQLPPVKSIVSPALDAQNLSFEYSKEVVEIELDEVMRQHQDSGILKNATQLREFINENEFDEFKFNLAYDDMVRLVDGYEIQDAINDSFNNKSIEDTAIIVWSNKRANLYNQQIRQTILGREGDIATGDYVMIVKNNYYWLDESSEAGFIANGDTAEILSIRKRSNLYGFNFAEATIRLLDYPNQAPIDVILMLDTLNINAPSLTYEDSLKFYNEVVLDYQDEKSKSKIYQKVKENKYFNALQIKFSYAITCHKAQGGQWKNVFIEKPYLPEGQNIEYWRWLYTALTRAQEKVYLIGYTNSDFEK